jgi:tetratricopeptide (TPR) repeat protein
VAHDPEIRSLFPDGVLWAPLGTTPDTFGQLRRWAALLGLGDLDARHPDSLPLAIRSAIGNQHVLLILDDAWKMEDILALQVGGPHCGYLVTTRFLHLTRLVADMPVSLGEFSTEQSLDLLRQLAPQVVEAEARRTYALIEAVGGLPLALTLMGNYLRLHAIGGQSRRIQEALEQLNHAEMRLHLSELRGPLQHHPSLFTDQSLSLHTVIGLTNQHLSQQARATLFALGVLPHKPAVFSEAAALAVGACPTSVLDTLVDMGLLESAGDGYYTLHQTISDYARLHLQGNAPHERLITYAVAFLQTHHADYDVLDRELSTLLLALEAASPLNQQAGLIHLACAIAPFLMLRGNYPLAERHLQQAYEAAGALADDSGIMTTLLLRGQVAQKQGDYRQAETNFREALTLARKNNDPERISAALKDLGRATWKRGNYALAEVYLKEGLALARQIEDPERICDVLQVLGVVLDIQGNYLQEMAYLQEGLTLARNMGDVERVCEALIHLGVALIEHGDATRGEMHLQEGLALARSIGHKEWICALLTNLGSVITEQGNYEQAEIYVREGLALAEQIGHSEWTCVLLNNLGAATYKQGNYAQAEVYLQQGIASARHIGLPQMEANALCEYGNFFLDQQKAAIAEEKFSEALAITPVECRDLRALAQYGLARAAIAQDDVQRAQQLGAASSATLEKTGHYKAQEVRTWLGNLSMI